MSWLRETLAQKSLEVAEIRQLEEQKQQALLEATRKRQRAEREAAEARGQEMLKKLHDLGVPQLLEDVKQEVWKGGEVKSRINWKTGEVCLIQPIGYTTWVAGGMDVDGYNLLQTSEQVLGVRLTDGQTEIELSGEVKQTRVTYQRVPISDPQIVGKIKEFIVNDCLKRPAVQRGVENFKVIKEK